MGLDSLQTFQQLERLNDSYNYVELDSSNKFVIKSHGYYFGWLTRLFNHWIWKSENTQYSKVSNAIYDYYNTQFSQKLNNYSIEDLNTLNKTLSVVTTRWAKVKNKDKEIYNKLIEAKQLVNSTLHSADIIHGKESFNNYLADQKLKYPTDSLLFDQIAQSQNEMLQELNNNTMDVFLAANIFGDKDFDNKKYAGRLLEGPGSERAIWTFYSGLTNYYESVKNSLPVSELTKLKEILDAYNTFLLSALIRRNLKAATNATDEEKKKWTNFGAKILENDIKQVKEGKKSRGYWLAGSRDHFVPLRYEYVKAENRFVMGTFNLGGGVMPQNIQPDKKASCETRIKSTVQADHDFCKNIVAYAALRSINSWVTFINPKSHTNTPMITKMPKKNRQKMGDCTCKGQWALLEKEFDRFFTTNPDEQYHRFKRFFQKATIAKIDEESPTAPLQNDELSKKQIYDICQRHIKD